MELRPLIVRLNSFHGKDIHQLQQHEVYGLEEDVRRVRVIIKRLVRRDRAWLHHPWVQNWLTFPGNKDYLRQFRVGLEKGRESQLTTGELIILNKTYWGKTIWDLLLEHRPPYSAMKREILKELKQKEQKCEDDKIRSELGKDTKHLGKLTREGFKRWITRLVASIEMIHDPFNPEVVPTRPIPDYVKTWKPDLPERGKTNLLPRMLRIKLT